MRTRVSIPISCLIFAMAIQVLLLPVSSDASDLQVGYYKSVGTCPEAELLVKSVVNRFVRKDPGLGAGLIRMFFHDCFVRGCDASVLLDQSASNPDPEKNAIPNNPSLRGFEVIDAAKDILEKACPGKVSCADIIAFAARDAANILGGICYDIPSGRYDGMVSKNSEALSSLPAPSLNLDQLKAAFLAVGLSTTDLVTLSGAHSIGRSHCSSFTSRLYPTIDRTMDQTFGMSLRTKCPANASTDGVVPQDSVTPDNLDGQYYKNVKSLEALFFSDWSLLTSSETRKLVDDYSTTPGLFESSFGQSMVNMGNIGVLNKNNGEIRRSSCRAVNNYY
ncbi:hypothetical protein LUZ60_006961 [Juncus effusus]|nr:hypothetical protein LUZ60_006961 [Juncus effusus]